MVNMDALVMGSIGVVVGILGGCLAGYLLGYQEGWRAGATDRDRRET